MTSSPPPSSPAAPWSQDGPKRLRLKTFLMVLLGLRGHTAQPLRSAPDVVSLSAPTRPRLRRRPGHDRTSVLTRSGGDRFGSQPGTPRLSPTGDLKSRPSISGTETRPGRPFTQIGTNRSYRIKSGRPPEDGRILLRRRLCLQRGRVEVLG